jgi:hypothetical protein
VLLPCGHGGYCGACSQRLLAQRTARRQCPMCRTPLTCIAKISLSTPIGAQGDVLKASVARDSRGSRGRRSSLGVNDAFNWESARRERRARRARRAMAAMSTLQMSGYVHSGPPVISSATDGMHARSSSNSSGVGVIAAADIGSNHGIHARTSSSGVGVNAAADVGSNHGMHARSRSSGIGVIASADIGSSQVSITLRAVGTGGSAPLPGLADPVVVHRSEYESR